MPSFLIVFSYFLIIFAFFSIISFVKYSNELEFLNINYYLDNLVHCFACILHLDMNYLFDTDNFGSNTTMPHIVRELNMVAMSLDNSW
jgi:hypothetical protein